MDTKIFNKLNQLKIKIDFHDNKYHSEDNPEISDFEYDKLCREYDTLINENPGFKFLERKTVGSQTSNQFQKYNHRKPMTSLTNAFSLEDVNDFIERTLKFLHLKKDFQIDFMCEPKIDGLSISLLYVNGNLFNAVTRGDGKVGEIVTDNVKTINDIPHKLKGNYPNLIEIRGEIFMKKANFEEQDSSMATYAKKIQKIEGKINWNNEADEILAKINGLYPQPGAWFSFENDRHKILRATLSKNTMKPGEIIDDELTISCGNKSIKVTEIQREGKKPQKTRDFLLGSKLKKGIILKNE